MLQRKFAFDVNYDPDVALPRTADRSALGTILKLVNFKDPYRQECSKATEQIIQRIIEHFILVFLGRDCPSVELVDLGKRTLLNSVFKDNFKQSASEHRFRIKNSDFVINGFRLTAPRAAKHKLIYAANSRGVVSDNLQDHIPNLTGRLFDASGQSFVYLGVVQSPYLTQRVNNARTDFDLGPGEDAEAEEPTLLADEIERAEIRSACLEYINRDLSDILQGLNAAKEERILKYVHEEAPQYKILMKYRHEFIDQISPMATKNEIEAALHGELFQREQRLKLEGSRIIKDADKIDDADAYESRFSEFMDKYNELGVSALAQYVAHRKIILDFLERAISRNPKDGQYPLEKVVHSLIFPMRETSDDVPYSQQNLWIIDERLTYHSFISSDKPLAALTPFESKSQKRPDLFIFDRKIAFAEGEQPIASIIVVEFKRPQRDDYGPNENPLTQAFEMINEIRAGRFKDARGRPISVAGDKIPAVCYIVCDLTPSLERVLLDMDGAEKMPDNQGYYGYHRRRSVYYEVIDYNKLLRDAKKRNRIFFDKLNILGSR